MPSHFPEQVAALIVQIASIVRPRLPLRSLLALAVCIAGFALPGMGQTPGANQWTWMGGNSTVSAEFGVWPGVYGTRGTPAPGNIPPTRVYEVTWTGSDGRFWLFGGNTFTSGLNYFNDLWVFDPATNEWTWMAGASTFSNNCPIISTLANCGQSGVYGTLGTPAADNSPGGRESAQGWTDTDGNLWLYGGEGFDGAGNFVALNDLWEFNTSSGEWAWMGGACTVPVDTSCDGCLSGLPPIPGTQGTPAAANTPGGLWLGTTWTDKNGNFWLFAGWGYGPTDFGTVANDLWTFNPTTGQWTWVGGSANLGLDGGVAGTYGILKTPAAGNFPGTRWSDATWVDASGNLWLFGGEGYDSTGANEGILNDLWEYDSTTGEWAWMGGSSTFSCANYPQQDCHESGVYGTRGQASPSNIPGSRFEASSWTDKSGNFWLFGGDGFDSNSDWTYLNDLWQFNPATNEWTWVNGSSNTSEGSVSGVYGQMGVASSANVPGIRNGAASWTDKNGNLWLWGGTGLDSAGAYGYLNDLWRYQPPSAVVSVTTATPVFSPGTGNYATVQSVTISDSTAGAIIYYTTDGTTPTPSSRQYNGPINVDATETIQAMATAPNDGNSAVASATYTIPDDFTFSINPTSLLVQAGASASTTITVQDEGGFNANVVFACSGLPQGATCSFTPETVPTHAGVSYTTLTLSAPATTTAYSGNRGPLVPASMLAAAVCFLGWRRRRWMQLLLIAVCIVAMGGLGGCAALNPSGGYSTSTVTVTATSGALSHSTSLTLTMN